MPCLFIFLAALLHFSEALADSIVVEPGHQKIIPGADVVRVSIGDPKVADVKVLTKAKQVIITGLSLGNTDLIFWLRSGGKVNYTLSVKNGTARTIGEAEHLLKGIEGVELRTVGGKWVLEGEIYRSADLEKIRQALSLFPNIVNHSRINRIVLKFIAEEIKNALHEAKLDDIELRIVGEKIYMEGTTAEKNESVIAGEIAKSFYINIVNQISFEKGVAPQVFVDTKLMEIKTNSLGQIGLKWPGSLDATGGASWATGSGFTANLAFNPSSPLSLQSLVQKGVAKILSNPKLLCRSGTPATFLAGGEFPIRLISERTASVTFKQYGVLLEITVHANRTRNLFLEIESKISDLDQATSVDGIPGILEHRIKTAASLRYGDTVVLGGLFEDRSRKNIQKVPFLGHIPILGELFKSRDFQKSESEFLIFLTPIPAPSTNNLAGKEIEQIQKAKSEHPLNLSIFD